MKRTISIAKGKGSIGHNSREFRAENIDPDRVHLNTCYINEDLQETYHKLFDNALENYNTKLKRADRKIPDYYEKIRTSKQEKLFYEIIVQVGNFEDMHATSENGKIAEEILHKYMADFQKRNPTLHVFSAHLHMDEATPHLHIDFVPYTTGNKRGLETKNTLKGALNQLGFTGGTRGSTELNQWQDSEKEFVAKLMLEHGIEWEKKGTHKEQLSVLEYKKEKRAEEVIQLEEKIDTLEDKSVKLDTLIEEKSNKAKCIETTLDSLMKQHKNIQTNIHAYYEEAEWLLPETTGLATAKSYKDKKAQPLVDSLKEVIRGLVVKLVNLTQKYKSLLKEKNYWCDKAKQLSSLNDENSKNIDNYIKLEQALGKRKVHELIQEHQQKSAPKVTKKKEYER